MSERTTSRRASTDGPRDQPTEAENATAVAYEGRDPRRGVRTVLTAVATVTLLAIVVTVALGVRSGAPSVPDAAPSPPPAPDFAMVAYQGQAVLGGDDVRLSQLIGTGTPIVVNFWASACPPCREEMPGFQRVVDELGTRFTLVGVDVGPFVGLGTRAGAEALLAEYAIDYPAAYAVDDASVRAYDIFSMPMTLFFDGTGRIVGRHTGYLSEARFRGAIEGLLASAE